MATLPNSTSSQSHTNAWGLKSMMRVRAAAVLLQPILYVVLGSTLQQSPDVALSSMQERSHSRPFSLLGETSGSHKGGQQKELPQRRQQQREAPAAAVEAAAAAAEAGRAEGSSVRPLKRTGRRRRRQDKAADDDVLSMAQAARAMWNTSPVEGGARTARRRANVRREEAPVDEEGGGGEEASKRSLGSESRSTATAGNTRASKYRGGGSASREEDAVVLEEEKERQKLEEEEKSIRLSIVTWNMAESSPAHKDCAFIDTLARDSDIVVLSVQEIENLKPRRQEGSRSREWRRLTKKTLGKDWVRLGHHVLGSIHLSMFCRRRLVHRCKVVKMSEVACGVGNVLQNKGGVGAFLRVDKTTILLVGAHLAAHQGKVAERNADYWRIMAELEAELPLAWVKHALRKRKKLLAGDKRASQESSLTISSQKGRGGSTSDRQTSQGQAGTGSTSTLLGANESLLKIVDRCFFFGDLNYRVDLSREDVELGVEDCLARAPPDTDDESNAERAATSPFQQLLDFDQLTVQRSRGSAFLGFSEGCITFPPTYKYKKGGDVFDPSAKMRVPAWTDRILFAPAVAAGSLASRRGRLLLPDARPVKLLHYFSVPDSRHSDHRPVVAQFQVLVD